MGEGAVAMAPCASSVGPSAAARQEAIIASSSSSNPYPFGCPLSSHLPPFRAYEGIQFSKRNVPYPFVLILLNSRYYLSFCHPLLCTLAGKYPIISNI
jgi:hypothetical protein